MSRITKAVFPVAGMGTRFLPATKANPKKMMPVVDKPLVRYAVEEAVAAGMAEMIFVTGRGKRAIEDHFDTAFELEKRGQTQLLMEEELLALECKGTRYDCGSKIGYLKAGLRFVRRHPEVGAEFRRYLRAPGKR